MNKQKELDILKEAILTDETRELVEVISSLPRDYRLIFTGQVMGFVAAKGIMPEPPRPTATAAAVRAATV